MFTHQNNKRFEGIKRQLSDVRRIFAELELPKDYIRPAPNLEHEAL